MGGRGSNADDVTTDLAAIPNACKSALRRKLLEAADIWPQRNRPLLGAKPRPIHVNNNKTWKEGCTEP